MGAPVGSNPYMGWMLFGDYPTEDAHPAYLRQGRVMKGRVRIVGSCVGFEGYDAVWLDQEVSGSSGLVGDGVFRTQRDGGGRSVAERRSPLERGLAAS